MHIISTLKYPKRCLCEFSVVKIAFLWKKYVAKKITYSLHKKYFDNYANYRYCTDTNNKIIINKIKRKRKQKNIDRFLNKFK
jgi:hypothetical protein